VNLKHYAPWSRHLLEYAPTSAINVDTANGSLVRSTCHSLPLSSSTNARKRLWPFDDGGGDDDSSDSSEEEIEEESEEEPEEEAEEVSSEETLVNQLDTSEEKLFARRIMACSSAMTATTPRRHQIHAPPKVTGAPTWRAAAMMTMTSGCR
jgi:hypothetical protein